MKVMASRSDSDILVRTITTASRRRQKADTVSFSSCMRLFFVVIMPRAYSLQQLQRQTKKAKNPGAR